MYKVQELKIATYNPHSINNKTIDVLEYIKDLNLDIILIQESWLKEEDGSKLAEIKELGYNILSNPRKRRGGGLAVLYKQHLKLKPNTKASKFKSFENMEVTMKTDDKLIRFTNVYRPPYSRKHRFTETDFLREFEEYLCYLNLKSGETIIMGDFNIHFQKRDNPHSILLNELFKEYSYKQVVPLHPTHMDGNTLDLILLPNEFQNKIANVHIDKLVTLSDHYLVYFILKSNITLEKNQHKFLEYRKFSSMNVELFKQEIKETNLFKLQSDTFSSADEACLYYQKTLTNILNKHCPIVKRKLLNKHEVWFDDELRDFRRKRRRIERKLRKKPSLSGKKHYNETCKAMTSLMKMKRKKFTQASIEKAEGNSKKLYSQINSLLGKGDKILPDTHSDEHLAENFKTFFTKKIENIRKDIENDQIQSAETVNTASETTCELNTFKELSKDDLRKLLFGLPNKSSKLDILPIWLLKDCFNELVPILMFIVNMSIANGEFPQSLKHAIVTPVLKNSKEDIDDLKNYRPISNLSTISKLLEKAIYQQLNDYLNSNELYCEVQSGYRKGHSCETLLIKLNDDLIKEADKNNFVALLLLDLSAAFDAVDHGILLHKLQSLYGIKSHALKWFKSYLANRTFSVSIRKTDSSIEIVLYGVPQGSILGPILFILYTKEVSDIVHKYSMQLKLYADDSTLYMKLNPANTSDINFVISTIQSCLCEIKNWMTNNYMKLNEDKTQLIVFGKRYNLNKFSTDMNIEINGSDISSLDLSAPGMKDKGKSLGVMLNNDLSMQRQISMVKQSSYNTLHNLRNIKEYLTVNTKITLVKSLILSKVDFCNSLYTNIPQYQTTSLKRLLNFCVRFIYNLPKRSSVSEYYLKSHILPIDARIEFKTSLLVHKCVHAYAPPYLSGLVKFNDYYNSPYSLRSEDDYFCLQTAHTARTSNLGWRRFSIYAPVIWNKLPYELRICTDIEKFKTLLKTCFF